jgi:hypothetical protein
MTDNAKVCIAASDRLEDLGKVDYTNIRTFATQRGIKKFPTARRDVVEEEDEEYQLEMEGLIAGLTDEELANIDPIGAPEPFQVSYRDLCSFVNGAKFNTCISHSYQVLIRDTITKFRLLGAIKKRVDDITAFGKKRQGVRAAIKKDCKKTLVTANWTRWNTTVDSVARLADVSTVVAPNVFSLHFILFKSYYSNIPLQFL